jgi:hypothetical protein
MSTSDDDGEQATAARPGPRGDHHNQALRDIFDANRDIHLDGGSGQNVSGQHVEVHIVNHGLSPGGPAPDGGTGSPAVEPPGEQRGGVPGREAGGRRGQRRRRFWLAIGTVVVLLIVVIVILTPSPRPRPGPSVPTPVTTVQLLGNDVLFSDPGVQRELRRQGIVVQQTLPDSRTICTDTRAIADYDISDTSKESAQCYKSLAQKAGKAPDVYNPYEGLMVIVTYKPIVTLLERLDVASEVNGITVFDVAKYLKVFASGKRWTGIKPNTGYRNHNRILLWTTNPKESNLGGMLAAIAYAAQTGGDPPTSISPHDPYVPVIRSLFTELGELPTYSVLLLNQFLAGGMGEYPMAMVYESQYLSTKLTGIATDPRLTVMYPTPDVSSEDTLVAWTPAGKKLINVLQSKPIAALEEAEGYRTVADKAGFVTYMAGKGIPVLDLDELEAERVQFASLPTKDVLTELINAVATSQPA